MRAALYIRVSTEEQGRDGFSIDAQKTLLIQLCEKEEWDIESFYIDEGYSAKDMKRPELQRLIKNLPSLDVVIFWRLDRLTRNSRNFQQMQEVFSSHNVAIKSATENIDTTTAQGRFVLELSVSLAQLERETTAERVHFVMEDRHRKGLRNGAVAPFGYDLIDGVLTVNNEKADIVKKVFHLYLRNNGMLAIAKKFNQDPLMRKHKDKWNYTIVRYILMNPIYHGKLRWNYRKLSGKPTGKEIIVDSEHESIIDTATFEEAQRQIELRAERGKRVTSYYAFTGVLRCERCGYAMIGSSRKTKYDRKRFYKCLGRFNYGICTLPIISEESVIEAFLAALESPADTWGYFDLTKFKPEEETNKETLAYELRDIERRKKKLQEAYLAEAISLDDLKSHNDVLWEREKEISKVISITDKKDFVPWSKEEVIEQLKQLHKVWHQIEDEVAKKNFIQHVFDYIKINTDVEEAKGGPGRRVPIEIKGWGFNL